MIMIIVPNSRAHKGKEMEEEENTWEKVSHITRLESLDAVVFL